MDGPSCIKDRNGNELHFGNCGDIWIMPTPKVTNFREHLQKIRDLELKEDDVILASFPRSGTNWHHQILQMLVYNTVDYIGLLGEKHWDWLPTEEFTITEQRRVLTTHFGRFHRLPRQVKEKKVKVVYNYRNPKDTWVSLYNMTRGTKFMPAYEGTWSHFFDLMIDIGYWYGDWFDHILDWEKAASENPDIVFISCYEEMKKDPVGQIMKIDQFLGLNRGKEMCEKIAEACQFSKLKSVKDSQLTTLVGENYLWKSGSAGLYRKGEIGDWKNWFTIAQNEQFDAVFKKRMSQSKLQFTFE